MSDASPSIQDRAADLFAESFGRLFVKPLKERIRGSARWRVERSIGDISEAAASGLARFLNAKPPKERDADFLFDETSRALTYLEPADVWPPEGAYKARVESLVNAARAPDWLETQAALFGIALDHVVAALWQAGEVFHEWEKFKFAEEYEPPRQLAQSLQNLGSPPPSWPTPQTDRLDDISFEARYYFELQRSGRLDIGTLRTASAITVSLSELFVMPHVGRAGTPSCFANEVLLDKGCRITVLIGPPGSGKSTLLRWLLLRTSDISVDVEQIYFLGEGPAIPILIRLQALRGWSAGELAQLDRLVLLATGRQDLANIMPEGWLGRQFADGRVLLLLDGLDEMDPFERDGVLFPWLEGLLKAHPTWRAVITSRPAGFSQARFVPPEGTPSEGTFKPWNPGLYEIQEFGPDEVLAYLRNWCTQVRLAQSEPRAEAVARGREEGVVLAEAVSKHPAVDQLARTPLLLSAICLVYRFGGKRLPEDRADLYGLCVQGLLDRWETQKGLASPFPADVKLRVCRELAARMMNERTTTIALPEALRVAERVLGSATAADALLRHVLNRAGLLIERQPNVLSFAHLTFQEYLAALAVRNENGQGLTPDSLAENHCEPWWREVILLYCKLAQPPMVRQLFDRIQRADPTYATTGGAPHKDQKVHDHCVLILLALDALPADMIDDQSVRSAALDHLLSCQIGETRTIKWDRGNSNWFMVQKVFTAEEVAGAIRSGAGLGRTHEATYEVSWTWASRWVLDEPSAWPMEADDATLSNWRTARPADLAQATMRYYALSTWEELDKNGRRIDLWLAPMGTESRLAGIRQAESVMAGLTARKMASSGWVGAVDLLKLVPEQLLVEIAECCCSSKWPQRRMSSHYYLFNNFTLVPSTTEVRDRFVAAFRVLANDLTTTTPAGGLRKWLNAVDPS